VGGNGRSPWKVDSLVAEHFELDGVVVEAVLAQDLHGAHHGFPAGASLGCARIPSASQEGSNKLIAHREGLLMSKRSPPRKTQSTFCCLAISKISRKVMNASSLRT
jgi:hypothetical protein